MIYHNPEDLLQYLQVFKGKFLLAGLDVGEKSIGIATLSSEIGFAMPYRIVAHSQLLTVIKEISPHAIIMGHNQNNKRTYYKKQVCALDEINYHVAFQDESYSSVIADNVLKSLGLNRRRRNAVDDMHAAKLILDWFYEGFVKVRKNVD